ncbi:unnamed protein product, partial [marine sediment metagenome]
SKGVPFTPNRNLVTPVKHEKIIKQMLEKELIEKFQDGYHLTRKALKLGKIKHFLAGGRTSAGATHDDEDFTG